MISTANQTHLESNLVTAVPNVLKWMNKIVINYTKCQNYFDIMHYGVRNPSQDLTIADYKNTTLDFVQYNQNMTAHPV